MRYAKSTFPFQEALIQEVKSYVFLGLDVSVADSRPDSGHMGPGKVNGAYSKYSRVPSQLGRPASQVVADLLRRNGNNAVEVTSVSGNLTDHYNPATETLALSQGVYGSTSIAALGIAAHEAGHAMQKMEGYAPMRLRTAVVPLANFGSNAYFPLFLLGIIFSWQPLIYLGILCFALSVVFSLITLPVEFNASSRAIAMLSQGGYITREEEPAVKAVLSAAALTYVAAAVTSILSLLRLLIIARNRD